MRTVRLTFYLLLLSSYILVSSCKKENMCDCIKSTGDIVKEKRSVPDFNSIEVHDNIYVELTQDTVNTLEVEAGENILPLIKTKVTNGNLLFENDNKCNWVRSYKKKIIAHLHVKNLEFISSYTGRDITSTNTLTTPIINIYNFHSGDIQLDIFSDESFTKQMGSGGDITVTGYTDFNYVFSFGYGIVHLENLGSRRIVMGQHGTGDMHVNTRDSLDVEIKGSGNVFYRGNPLIIQRPSSGSGRLIKE